MATPSFLAIRNKYPEARVHLLVGKWSRSVVENNPNIDEIISVDENIFWKKKIFHLFKLFLKLRSKRFEIIYVMHWSNFFNLFALWFGAKERIGFDRFNRGAFLTKKVLFKEGERGLHIVEKYLKLVEDNLQNCSKKMDLYLTEDEINSAQKKLEVYGLFRTNRIVGIAPGGGINPKSRMSTRCWPIKYFSELVNKIINELNMSVVLFGAEMEKNLSRIILNDVINKNKIVNLIGKTNLRESSAIMKMCRVMIANDSAPLHLAAAVGIKTISIFGPTAPYDKAPIGKEHFYFYRELICSPCYKYGKFKKCKTLSCMKLIKPDEVFRKVKEFSL